MLLRLSMPQEISQSAEHKEWLETELDEIFKRAKLPNANFTTTAIQIMAIIVPELQTLYGPDSSNGTTSRLFLKVKKLLEILPDHDLRNKRIVELGCGSENGPDQFKPWFCRFLHILGAHPVGVDIGVNDKEPFENHLQDLTREDSLKMIKSDSADIVLTDTFFDSPTLQRIQNENRIKGENTRRILFPQIQRILKPDGLYMNQSNWTKTIEDQYVTYGINDLNFDKWIKREITMYQDAAADPAKSALPANNMADLTIDQYFHEHNDSELDPVMEWRKLIHIIEPLIENIPGRDLRGKKILYISDSLSYSPENPISPALGMLNANVTSINDSSSLPEDGFDAIIIYHASCFSSASREILSYAKQHLSPEGLLLEISPNGRSYSDRIKKREEL